MVTLHTWAQTMAPQKESSVQFGATTGFTRRPLLTKIRGVYRAPCSGGSGCALLKFARFRCAAANFSGLDHAS